MAGDFARDWRGRVGREGSDMGAGLSAALGQRAREVCRARLRSDAGGWVRRFGRATRVACGPNGRRGEELGRARMLRRQWVSGPCGARVGAGRRGRVLRFGLKGWLLGRTGEGRRRLVGP